MKKLLISGLMASTLFALGGSNQHVNADNIKPIQAISAITISKAMKNVDLSQKDKELTSTFDVYIKNSLPDEIKEYDKNINDLKQLMVTYSNQVEEAEKVNNEKSQLETQLKQSQSQLDQMKQQINDLKSKIEAEKKRIADEEAKKKAEEETKRQQQLAAQRAQQSQSAQAQTVSTGSAGSSQKLYSLSDFMFRGVVNWNGNKFTYYSQQVLPGGGLSIPGRHVSADGYVCDGDGYIVLAGSAPKGTIYQTPFGAPGKIYDRGTYGNHLDVYIR